ncbi:hypothetical protein H2199_001002 [Coniosporium tulheliwenetii]|uniref:Uncharacterized protein n=1 Tax=Coniosporium tulheliwenetii TaxID=3383036 RepID=A0ACC2ZNF7_9PEZI|nr:hypothetical protein H2199_001002 [Cladosporium sp. JES 115]
MAIGNPEINEKCTVLRQELKVWEKQFSAANGGRKAGRDDIKANATIASKYKEYNQLRDILSGKAPALEPSTSARKPKPVAEAAQTPSKRRSIPAATPKKLGNSTDNVHLAVPSSTSKLDFTPVAVRTMIGPTPKKTAS